MTKILSDGNLIDAPQEFLAQQALDAAAFASNALPAAKVAAKMAIDAAAENARLKYITPGAGQAMAYQAKADEATALLAAYAADPNLVPDPTQYPILAASVGIEAATIKEVAQLVDTTRQQWAAIAGQIEGIRLKAKADVDAAADVAAVKAILVALGWP